ncbi:MAG TPA: hypothetical protein VIL74_09030 [Pyrinomonadaceae bacterium]|jgi:hypothetical protein
MKPILHTTKLSPLNDPAEWLRAPMKDAPLSREQLAAVQRDVDSILGTTRGNESIARIVWNGDPVYWKAYYTHWNSVGKPLGGLRRSPQVLYKTIYDSKGKYVRDAFPPRYLLMTRIEPEQFMPTYRRDSRIFDPVYKCEVQLLPEQPPAVMWLWFQTIAAHNGLCCKSAAQNDVECYGEYAHPNIVLENLREIMRGIEASGVKQTDPFAAPDAVKRYAAENRTNNYGSEALRKFRAAKLRAIEETPLALAPAALLERGAPLATIRQAVKEGAKRHEEAYAKSLETK